MKALRHNRSASSMAKGMSVANKIRDYAAKERCFTSQDIRQKFGTSAATQLSTLSKKGEIDNPARGVYCLGGVHIDDPQLVAVLARAGVSLYPPEKRRHTGAERAARQRLDEMAKRDEPRKKLMAYAKKHKIFLVRDVKLALDAKSAKLATSIAQKGEELIIIQPGVYAVPEMKDDEDALAAFFQRRADVDREIVVERDTYRARYRSAPHRGTKGVTANLVEFPSKRDDPKSPLIKRVYINVPNEPTIFGQAKANKKILWKGKLENGFKLSDAAAKSLAATIFDPLPEDFHDLVRITEDPAFKRSPPKPRQRTGGYANFREHADTSRSMFPCGYTLRDVAALDPTKLSKPLPRPVTLLVDHREPDSIITNLHRVPNLNVLRVELEHGDYLVPDQMIFERKTTKDLFASLSGSERLIDQACRVHDLGLKTTLIIEGGAWGDHSMKINHLASTLSWLRYGKDHHIVETADEQFTCYVIVQAIKHYIFGLSSSARRPDPVKKAQSANSRRETQIFGISSWSRRISDKRAHALLDHFGSPAAIANASIIELTEVPGIGPTLAEEIHSILH